MRHGSLALNDEPWTAPRNLNVWIERYQSASIMPSEPPHEIKRQAASSMVVCSTALRCIESAQRIAPGREFLPDALYSEAGLPHNLWTFPKLPPALWALAFRLAWFRGFSAHAESYAEAKVRADLAAEQLIALAQARGPVLLVGHGIVNVLIARRLLALGWCGPRRPATRHWGCSVYRLP
jgi:broad specificity phosphatase PhoE